MWAAGWKTMNMWAFKKQWIDAFYDKYKYDFTISPRKSIIIQLYDNYISGNDLDDWIYYAYQFIQYLMTISDKEFVT